MSCEEAEYWTDFRMIPLGDIDLQHDTGVIGRHRGWEHPRVRRVYSATVEGRNSSVTVAMYQGHGAEEVSCSASQRCLLITFSGVAAGYCKIYDGSASYS
jgi:hypothetical protein